MLLYLKTTLALGTHQNCTVVIFFFFLLLILFLADGLLKGIKDMPGSKPLAVQHLDNLL